MSKSEDIPIVAPTEAELDASLNEFTRYHSALTLMRVVARAKREMIDNDNRLSWRTRVDLASALTFARVWFGVSEEEINEH